MTPRLMTLARYPTGAVRSVHGDAAELNGRPDGITPRKKRLAPHLHKRDRNS